ncbi:MAG: DinB family protein [Blastocatellia bacterium]
MNDSTALTSLLLAKVEQQVELTIALVARVPVERLEWRPVPEAFELSHLLGHLLEACAGFCAALYRVRPQPLAHFARLRDLPVNHACDPAQAVARLRDYLNHIREGFAILTDADLARLVPTLFVPAGEALLTILLANLEHLINHKHQLFFYLKLLGVEVGTAQLYDIQAPPAS